MFLLIQEFPICEQSPQLPLALQFIKFDVQTQMNPFISGSTALFARFYPPDAMNRITIIVPSRLAPLNVGLCIIPLSSLLNIDKFEAQCIDAEFFSSVSATFQQLIPLEKVNSRVDTSGRSLSTSIGFPYSAHSFHVIYTYILLSPFAGAKRRRILY
jgi:hypothetical protein